MSLIADTHPNDDQSELLEEQSEFLQVLAEYARVQSNLLMDIRRYLQFFYGFAIAVICLAVAAGIITAIVGARNYG